MQEIVIIIALSRQCSLRSCCVPGICVEACGDRQTRRRAPGPTQRETQSDGGGLTSRDTQRSECLDRGA